MTRGCNFGGDELNETRPTKARYTWQLGVIDFYYGRAINIGRGTNETSLKSHLLRANHFRRTIGFD